ncbi:MAG: putative lipid II flippase FtsW [Zymomonas mobilis subsp. pomaceae]|uniref:Probable peptidoglycan glycosyltransferase FtsW n=1 Tax=Zymomonas mobilis subsp. pomaceae (strain ATCC 29192 / DSM 22645 / JCM 10191 / CCUG 17912 / NBRC 13757 / NCIMB 11200 / NRRL B-4491 / Barker I) TaxID=579138 RepID=F8EVC9_ZYMMT|nr:putative lipid II flippase FtsW [Zymomonas mobilis]AEI37336.1 cell division protein FtsW [Zymomonas mobilis subsp. pomaceae ATCC 29192]MDX5948704.1 putative lipid II flippase FtsW [Zymomonas mobilis subsp. pomaceae]GEB88509.1 cell division protein FtsW [Zymomonas mobilis subsp. pomaceae]
MNSVPPKLSKSKPIARPKIAKRSLQKQSKRSSRLGRSDRSALGRWFWEIDHFQLFLISLLVSIGLVAVAAASPAISAQEGKPPFYYFTRQLFWCSLGMPVMILISMAPKDIARRASVIGAIFFLCLLALVPFLGVEVNGAKRWLGVGLLRIQPSEFLKPLFVVTMAWLLSFRFKDRSLPVIPISMFFVALVGLLLMKQPDFGQTVIFSSVWLVLLLLSGVSLYLMIGLGLGAMAGVFLAYQFYSVAHERIDAFLNGTGDHYHVDRAMATLTNGGFVGVGPGSGIEKFRLPEAHNDYIFSVIGEEFGLLACILIAFIYGAVIIRVFSRLLNEDDSFLLLASAGLATQFGLQALINMAVNVQILPSKGMTLPFISYGGSSLVAMSIGFGLLLAFTRRNPYLARSTYLLKWQRK